MTIDIHIGEAPLIAEQITVPGCGSAVTFSGIVRGEENGAAIEGLYYEAYEPMARRVMHDLLSELAHTHPCERVRVAHRIGWVPVGEAAIIVQVYSRHRQEGFNLLAAFMDRLKQDVPIWKRVTGARASCSQRERELPARVKRSASIPAREEGSANIPARVKRSASIPVREEGSVSIPAREVNTTILLAGTSRDLEGCAPFFDPTANIEKTRHWLPHWQQEDVWQFVTWRLADSLPAHLLDQWQAERAAWLRHHPTPWSEQVEDDYHRLFSDRIEEWLDAGHGGCYLRQPECAQIVEEALAHFHGQRYQMACYVIMPNHVHVLFQTAPQKSLHDVLHSWKSYTAQQINRHLRRRGVLWQHEYFDRMIRNAAHFQRTMRYILDNPQKAKLHPTEYRLATFPVKIPDEYGRA